MPFPRTLIRVLLAVALAAVFLPSAKSAAALDPASFVASTSAWAQAEERESGVPASVAMAQAILESGWGDSSLTKKTKNWFGIKCSPTPSTLQNGCFEISTTEFDESGKQYQTVAKFRKYDTDQNSFIDHGLFLKNLPRYSKAFSHTDNPDRFIVEVHLGGYATDPQYANKIIDLMVRYDLYKYNLATPASAASELVIQPQTLLAVGATGHVTGLLSPDGAGRPVWTQVDTGSGWSTDQTITASSRGQFTLPLTSGMKSVGVTNFRVQADTANGILTSSEFGVERHGAVTVLGVASAAVGEAAQLNGVASGYAGYTVTAQELINQSWKVNSSAVVKDDGSFQVSLASNDAAGPRSFRAQLSTSTNKSLTSPTVAATWEAKPAESEVPTPAESAVPTPAESAVPTPAESAVPTPAESAAFRSSSSIQRTAEQRIGGADRYAVSANVSRWLPNTDNSLVVVASGQVFSDALSAGPLAAHKDARLLLTGTTSLPPSVVAELKRNRPSEIVIAGGPGTVSEGVKNALAAYAPVTRIGGADRYAVAADIATRLPSKHVVIASGELFSDALSAGPLAAKLGGPLLLVRSGELPAASAEALRTLAPESVTVLGGPATVSDAVLNKIRSITGAPTTRVGGADRYQVAANVATRFFPTGGTAVFASGLVFPDGLSATPLAHAYNGPILLSTANCNSSYTNAAARSLKTKSRFFIGGTASVTSSGVQCGNSAVKAAVNPPAVTNVASTVPVGSPSEEAFYFVPHQDDELISMVGGIVSDVNAGRRVHVYLMHAGYWTGVKDSLCKSEKICLTNSQLTASRNAEFLSSLERMGVPTGNVHFLYTHEEESTASAIVNRAISDVVTRAGGNSHFRTMSWMDAHPGHYALGYALKDACSKSAKNDCLWFQSPLYQTRKESLQNNPVVTPRGAVLAAPAWQVTSAAAAYKENYPSKGRYSIGWRSVSSQIKWIEAKKYSWSHGPTWNSAGDEAVALQWTRKYQPGRNPAGRSSIPAYPLEEEG